MVYVFQNMGHVSGGHFNQAVTFSFLVTRQLSVIMFGVYVLAQLAGATLASAISYVSMPYF